MQVENNLEAVILATKELVSILQSDYNKRYSHSLFGFEVGNKYYKIIKEDNQRSVHAFVDRLTGDLYKASGWAKPAKGVRYNLLTDMELLRGKADWAGGYLYR